MNCHHLKENKKVMSDLHARDDDKRISLDSTEVDMINANISHVAWCSYYYLVLCCPTTKINAALPPERNKR